MVDEVIMIYELPLRDRFSSVEEAIKYSRTHDSPGHRMEECINQGNTDGSDNHLIAQGNLRTVGNGWGCLAPE
jgi:hypothetical protein